MRPRQAPGFAGCTQACRLQAVPAAGIADRTGLLPRNMQQPTFATGVIPLMDYSGMNTTKRNQIEQLL
ncbi:hypothetical protein [Xanthomonas pisi]|uniref:hypothetical protein n=1 Tax=Xanthomonas pisi TaxID=56457 RepID=UPI0011B090E6|nr:hypothetical protein [Xanthomonas pisi]